MRIVNGQLVNDDGTPAGPAPIPLPTGGAPLTPAATAPLGAPGNPITIIPPGEAPPAPAGPAPSPYPAGPVTPTVVAPPATKALTKTTTTTLSSKASPEEKAASEQVAAADKNIGDKIRAEGELGEKVAGAQAEGAAKQATLEDQNAAAVQAAIKKGNDDLAAERQKLAAMENGPKDYFEGHWGARIASAIAIGLGEFGAALAKTGHNTALEIVNKNIDDWRQERFQALKRQGERVMDAKQAANEALAQVNVETIARRQALAAHANAEAQRIGTPHAKLEAERLAAEQDRRAAAEARQYLESTRTRTQTSTERENTVGGPGAAGGNNLLLRDNNGNPIPLEGKVTPQGQALPAQARDAKAADEIDTMRAGTADLIANISRLKQMAQSGLLGRASAMSSGDAEGLRKETIQHFLRATVGRINEKEIENAEHIVPTVGVVNFVRDPVRVYDSFLERAKRQTVNELASKTNMSKGQAEKEVNRWYQGIEGSGASPQDSAAIQWARANPKDPRAAKILQANGL